jgi:hypothetical protein
MFKEAIIEAIILEGKALVPVSTASKEYKHSYGK